MAKAQRVNTQFLLNRWMVERYLHRLSVSPHRDWLMLKGGYLFAVWDGDLHRSTTDLDLHALDAQEAWRMQDVLRDIAFQPVAADDGLRFMAEGIRVRAFSGCQASGVCLLVPAEIGSARLTLKVKVAFGGQVIPGTELRWLTSLLPEMPAFQLRCYSRETAVAEKLAIGVEYGPDNTRLRDYYDVWHLVSRYHFTGHVMLDAVQSTFAARDAGQMLQLQDSYWEAAFGPTFAASHSRLAWGSWLTEHAPRARCGTLAETIQKVGHFALPLLRAAREQRPFQARWTPQGGWLPEITPPRPQRFSE